MMRERIDPDTGFTPTQQKKRFEELFNNAFNNKPTKTKTKRTIAKGPIFVNKKEKCIELLQMGLSVSQVAKDLGLTYGNVNYYKRFVK